MSLSQVSTGGTIAKGDINQAINILQQPSGAQEVRKYLLSGNCYIANGFISLYVASLSLGSTPVSVSIDSADVTKAAYMNAPATGHLTSGGFQVFSQFTSANAGGSVGGNYTIQY